MKAKVLKLNDGEDRFFLHIESLLQRVEARDLKKHLITKKL